MIRSQKLWICTLHGKRNFAEVIKEDCLCLWLRYGLFPSPQRPLLPSLEVSAQKHLQVALPPFPFWVRCYTLHISAAECISLSLYTQRFACLGMTFQLDSKGLWRQMVSYLYLYLKYLPQFLAHSKDSILIHIFAGLISSHFNSKC